MRVLPVFASASCLAVAVLILPRVAQADDAREIAAAMKWVRPITGKNCNFATFKQDSETGKSHIFEIRYRHPGQDQDSPDNVLRLFELSCARGASGATFVYVAREDSEFRMFSFAEPKLDYDYTDESFSSLKAPPKVAGYTATTILTDSAFDPKTNAISMNAKWRREGDAWSSGTWQLDDGQFILKRYDVDPTYEGSLDDNGGKGPVDKESYQVFPKIERNQ